MPVSPPSRRVLSLCVLIAASACGTSGGNQAASLAASAVSGVLSGSGSRERPEAWSTQKAHCRVFHDHRMACPTLRNCGALFGTADADVRVNACVDDNGDIDPVKWCAYGRNWCRASEFPACTSAESWPCDDFEIVICSGEDHGLHVLRSNADAVTGKCGYRKVTLPKEETPDAGGDSAT